MGTVYTAGSANQGRVLPGAGHAFKAFSLSKFRNLIKKLTWGIQLPWVPLQSVERNRTLQSMYCLA